MAYNGSIQLSAGITPLNGGDFKLADSKDVYYTDEQSVKDKLDNISGEITAAVGDISSFDYIIPENGQLPTSGTKGYIYLIPIAGGTSPNIYKEYIWITDKFELIGDTQMDLSGYLQSSDIADWAKADAKPTYTASEVGALPSTTVIPDITGLVSETWINQQGFIKDVSDKLDVTTYENNNITVAASLNDLHDQLIWEDEE